MNRRACFEVPYVFNGGHSISAILIRNWTAQWRTGTYHPFAGHIRSAGRAKPTCFWTERL